MQLYDIGEDLDSWGKSHRYNLKAEHKWQLPMVYCSLCHQENGWPEFAYPSVDCSQLPNELAFKKRIKAKTVDLLEMAVLQKQLEPLMPRGIIPRPFAQLGPLVGTASGLHGDFTWLTPWTPLIAPEAVHKLVRAGIVAPVTVKTEIKARGKATFQHLEIQAEPHGVLSERCFVRRRPNCPACGSSGVSDMIPPNLVRKSSIPSDIDLFRMRDWSTTVLVTERFAIAARHLGLTNIVFSPMEVVDE